MEEIKNTEAEVLSEELCEETGNNPTVETAEQTEAPAPAEEQAAAEECAECAENAKRQVFASKQEVIDKLKELAESSESVDRAELEHLKVVYYRLQAQKTAAEREAFIAGGGAAEDFMPEPDTEEEAFKEQYNLLRQKRAEAFAQAEQEKQQNLERKLAIIERFKQLAASPEEADKGYEEAKQLQAEWNELKLVPAEKATELWKNYQLYTEQYYDQLRLNHEFRAYDFKKNLEIKTRLCESAEKLAEVADPVSAFHQLQTLHQEFRETGPVAKELREEIWNRFKEASTVVNKRHQAYFEELKAREEENLRLKTEICEQLEAIDLAALTNFAAWDEQTKAVLEAQARWKTIGYTTKKSNTAIFERYRAACDKFFQAKTEYFRNTRDTLSANLAAKTALAEGAEALAESTDWAATTNKLIELQRQWKTIGPAPHKASEAVWKRFNEACNKFFNRKNEQTKGQREEEEANLEAKNAVIEQLEALAASAEAAGAQAVRDLQDKWNEIGHVPFRKKDKLYKRYREVLDKLYKDLHMTAGRRRLENFRKGMEEKGGSELTRELNRLQTALEAKRNEIKNYETNLSFFNSKSKTGNSLVQEVTRKIERLKEDLQLLQEKIKAVREQIKAEEA